MKVLTTKAKIQKQIQSKWSELKSQVEPDSIDILINGEINEDTVNMVMQNLQEIEGDVVVAINSPGGFLNDGLAIYNALRSHNGNVTTVNFGMAASAAGVIMLAGDVRIGFQSSLSLLHNAHTIAVGNAETFEAVAQDLRVADSAQMEIVSERLKMDAEAVRDFLAKDMLVDSDEALKLNIITEIQEHTPESKFEHLDFDCSIDRIEYNDFIMEEINNG